jgi:hypothetical protein
LFIGAAAETIVRAPFEIPDVPIPAIARPIINISEDFAAPHITEPSSKKPRNARKVYYMESEIDPAAETGHSPWS